MDAIDYILDGLERALALEAELGVKSIEFDRSLLRAPVAAQRAASAPAAPPVRPPLPAVSGVSAIPPAASASAPAQRAAGAPGAPSAAVKSLAAAISACTACPLAKTRAAPVPGQGNPDRPCVMFAGDFPDGPDESSGLAFSGRAGDLFDKMLAAMQLARNDVFITSICKCRPPGDRPPSREEQTACLRHLAAQAAAIRPRCIVVMTRPSTPLAFPFPRVQRGRWELWHGIQTIVTLHPAHVVRFAVDDAGGLKAAKTEIWNALKTVMKYIGPYRRNAPAENR